MLHWSGNASLPLAVAEVLTPGKCGRTRERRDTSTVRRTFDAAHLAERAGGPQVSLCTSVCVKTERQLDTYCTLSLSRALSVYQCFGFI